MFPQLSELDTPPLTLAGETVTLRSCSCQWWASITGVRPVLRNCVGGVIVGSTGHRVGLSNEGNRTLPHASTPHSHLQSQAPLPASIMPSVIDPRYSERQEAYKPSEDMALLPAESWPGWWILLGLFTSVPESRFQSWYQKLLLEGKRGQVQNH